MSHAALEDIFFVMISPHWRSSHFLNEKLDCDEVTFLSFNVQTCVTLCSSQMNIDTSKIRQQFRHLVMLILQSYKQWKLVICIPRVNVGAL
ncbi:hypothetical protein D3C80_1757730 [compost metagenome]